MQMVKHLLMSTGLSDVQEPAYVRMCVCVCVRAFVRAFVRL